MAALAKDPALIKLFGRTISLHDNSHSLENDSSKITVAEHCRNGTSRTMDESPSLVPCKIEQPQTSVQQSVSSQENSDSRAQHDESDDSGEPKSHKRPDKILPCPRCKSSDTKFCYFNNYNVNQPRHFCKSCQRYWTAGGTVRNVPIGAGRRRNKHLASQYRQLVASSDLRPTTVVETSDPRNCLVSCEESASSCTTSSPNEMLLKFGPESPHCHSAPNPSSQSLRNGCADINLHSYRLHEQGVRVINSDISLQQPLYNGSHHASGVTPYTNSCAPFPGKECNAQPTPNVSVQYVPTSYWNYIPVWVAGSGNMSLAVSNGCVSPPFFNNTGGVQVLGKHSRDMSEGEIAGEGISSTKTRRIHDIDES